MRKRIGIILAITGLVLLVKPNFDFDQIMLMVNYIIANYWPLGLIIVGVLLVIPQAKPVKRTKQRNYR